MTDRGTSPSVSPAKAGAQGYSLRLRRRHPGFPPSSIPVIMISGGAGEPEVALSLSLGAAAFLRKPFNLQEFLRTVDESLRPAGG